MAEISLRSRTIALLMLAAVLLGRLVGQAPPWSDAARAAIAAKIASDRIPGLSCAIAVRGETVFREGFGLADLENDVPATAQTVYRLASVSKPITAVAAMQLVEAGSLDLDADVRALVPEWPSKPWPVTTRQLLAHLGGVRHYGREGESTVHYATQTAALVCFAADPLLHEPGTQYLYSTYGFNLVAAVVEARSGQPFAAFVRERIALPSGATSLQDDDVRRIVRGRAAGYIRVGEQLQNSALMDSSYKLGGGGLCGSVEDLARFGAALLAGKLVRASTLAAMWKPQQTSEGKLVEYGLGFRVEQHDGRTMVSHGGAQSQVSTHLLLLPDAQVVVVVMCNLEKVRLQPLALQLALLAAKGATK